MLEVPALLLSFALASAYAVAFHLWKGRDLRSLLFFWLAAVIGFGSGQLVGQKLDLIQQTIGQVHVIEGTAVSFLFLALARWITQGKNTS